MVFGKEKHISLPLFWRQLLWKILLIILTVILLAQLAFIFMKGEDETRDALLAGRRLIYSLADASLQGKVVLSSDINSEKKEDDSQTTEEKNGEPLSKEEGKIETKDEAAVSKDNSGSKETSEQKQLSSEPEKEEEIINTLTVVSGDEEIQGDLPPLTPSSNQPKEFSSKLSEKTEFGKLPIISEKGEKPWKYYSKPIVVSGKKPVIAIIVTGLGKNKNISDLALRLPEEINLSFSPYASDLNSWMLSARTGGHEVMVDLPMEPSNYPASDPGPLGLMVSKDQTENEIKIKKLMAHDAGFVGFLSPQNEVLLENSELLKSLLQVVSGRGLLIAIGKTPSKGETKEIIEKGNAASVITDTLIDEELTESSIQARLSLLEQNAKHRGYAVGVAQSYPLTIKQLEKWVDKAKERGFVLVPVSFIVAKRF